MKSEQLDVEFKLEVEAVTVLDGRGCQAIVEKERARHAKVSGCKWEQEEGATGSNTRTKQALDRDKENRSQ